MRLRTCTALVTGMTVFDNGESTRLTVYIKGICITP